VTPRSLKHAAIAKTATIAKVIVFMAQRTTTVPFMKGCGVQ
jgi:hypothetical protein